MFDDTGGYTCWAIHGIQTGVNDANVAIFHGVSTVVHGSSVKYELRRELGLIFLWLTACIYIWGPGVF